VHREEVMTMMISKNLPTRERAIGRTARARRGTLESDSMIEGAVVVAGIEVGKCGGDGSRQHWR